MHSKVFSLTIDDPDFVPTMDDIETAIRLLDKHGITYFGYPSKEQGTAILTTLSYLRTTGMLHATAEVWVHVHEFEWLGVVPKDKIHTSDYLEWLPVFDMLLSPTQAFWRWYAKYHRDITYDEEPLHLSWYTDPPESVPGGQRFFIINEIRGDTIPGYENSWQLSDDFEKDYAVLIEDLRLALGKKIRVDDDRI